MTSFSLKGFARAADEMAVLQDRLPAAQLGPLADAAKKVLVAASVSGGGVDADEKDFNLRRPTKRNGFASVAIVGTGFAVLKEFGSYKKPAGWDIDPGFAFNSGTGRAKQGRVLADGKGFFAAYVHHPPIRPRPFVGRAELVIGGLAEKSYNAAETAIIRKAFG